MPPTQDIKAPGFVPQTTAAQVIGPTQQQYQVQPPVQPAATAPTTPAPAPVAPAAPVAAPTTAPQTAQNAPGQAQPALTMPGTGSVVDLLNMAGQDSSFAARKQLAANYGIQGYTGTAQQNQDLSKKYLDAYNANKGKAVPDTGAQATSAIDTYFKENTPETQEDPQRAFFDQYMAMNPIVKMMYDSINQMLSTPATTQTFKQEYDSLLQAQGVPGLQTELMNMKNIMDGTEDDLRTEIEKAGGFATESQVAALSAARNKTLLKQANVIQQQLALKEDYVNQIMQFSKLDRKQVEEDVDRKLGLTGKLADIQDKITTAAKDNYQKVVDKVGYKGLADAFAGDTRGMKMAEQALGLPKGALMSPSFLEANVSKGSMSGSIQEYEYAKGQGYKGSFIDYQNEDANRKKSIVAAGVAGLTPTQINSTVNSIAGSFDTEPLVKEYNTAKASLDTIKQIGAKTKSPTDDMAFIYAFAKIMDPNSVVREGEYKTVQDYGQALVQKAGLNLKRITDNSNFLTEDAKTKMLDTLTAKVGTLEKAYRNVASEYQRQIDDAYSGKPRQITNYGGSQEINIGGKMVPIGSIITNSKGKRGRVNADGTISPL